MQFIDPRPRVAMDNRNPVHYRVIRNEWHNVPMTINTGGWMDERKEAICHQLERGVKVIVSRTRDQF